MSLRDKLEFHNQAFDNKADFIRCLQYEVAERIQRGRLENHLLKLAARLEQIVSDTQDKMAALTDSMPAGNIQLNNQNHLEKLIQVNILISSLKAPGEAGNTDKLFKRFSHTDLASVLHLHFQEFKDKKFNTVQVKITEASDRLKINNPKVQKLKEALEAFFY